MKRFTLALCTIFFIFLGATNVFAYENTQKFVQPEKLLTTEELTKFFTENNIPKEKQEILIWKLDNNILWDCYNDEKLKLVPDDFSTIDIDGIDKEKYFRFEDGSFIKISFSKGDKGQVIKNTASPDGITPYGYGTHYKNHLVSRSAGTTTASFYATFFVSDYNSSMIYTKENSGGVYNSPFGGSVYGFGATGNPSMEMIRERESYGQAATFRMYWFTQATVSGTWGGVSGSISPGGTCNLYLCIKDSKVTIASTPVR